MNEKLEKLEDAAKVANLAMHKATGQAEWLECLLRYENAIRLIAYERPLDVFELMHLGYGYETSVVVASLTGGGRTDLGEECRTIHPDLLEHSHG